MRQVRQHIVLHIRVRENQERAAAIIASHPDVDEVENQGTRLQVRLRSGVTDFSHLANVLIQEGLRLTAFHEDELNLEAAFMALTKTS